MSTPRLWFLYPSIIRTLGPREVRPQNLRLQRSRCPILRSQLSTSTRPRQEAYSQRYGSAQEPQFPPLDGASRMEDHGQHTSTSKTDDSLANSIEQKENLRDTEPLEQQAVASETNDLEGKEQSAEEKHEKDQEPLSPQEDRGKAIEFAAKDPAERVRQLDLPTPSTPGTPLPPEGTDTSPSTAQTTADPPPTAKDSNTLSTVMAMPAPTIESPSPGHKPPHLQTPPYTHHFDTYTLVQRLAKGNYAPAQSEAIMKGMRALLSQNLDVARDSLVSKSDVENETYLFRAACSELRTEILNLRRSTTSKQKSQLSHLQHTFDILSQRTTAELASLRDELKGMLNERRMDNRQNSQGLDGRIAELSYKIGVRFAGEAKSGVEGLRWVMTRRSAMAFAGMVGMILGTLWYGSVVVHERERRAEERKKKGGSGAFMIGQGTQTEGPEQRVADDGKRDVADLAYTSLG